MRRLSVSVVCVCLSVASTASADGRAPGKANGPAARLEKVLDRVDYDEAAMADAVAFLGQGVGVDIRVDWKSLATVDVKRTTPVTLHLKKVPAAQALRLVLISAAGPGALDFVVRGKGLLVATPAAIKALQPLPPPPSDTAAVVDMDRKTDVDQAVLKKLDTAIPALSLNKTKMVDALLFYRRTAGVSIYVDWAALKSVGVGPDSEVTLQRKNTTVAAALRMTLAAAAPGKLGYAGAGGVVMVSTPRKLKALVAAVRRAPAVKTKADREAAGNLGRLIPSLKVDQTPLQSLMRFFGKTSGANLYVNWRALEAAAVKADAPVTLDLQRVTVRVAMALALACAAEPGAAQAEIAQGVVLVSTPKDAAALAASIGSRAPRSSAPKNRAIAEKLTGVFPAFAFDRVDLKTVIAFLRESTGVNIFVDWRSLRRVGIHRSSRVSLQLRAVTNRTALQLALIDAGGTGVAGYTIKDGILYVASTDVLGKLRSDRPSVR